jgi:hypothetical protein
MNESLERARAYYLVAGDMEQRGHEILRMAKELAEMADRLSEEAARKSPRPAKQPPPMPETIPVAMPPQPGDLDYDDSQNTSASEQQK